MVGESFNCLSFNYDDDDDDDDRERRNAEMRVVTFECWNSIDDDDDDDDDDDREANMKFNHIGIFGLVLFCFDFLRKENHCSRENLIVIIQ